VSNGALRRYLAWLSQAISQPQSWTRCRIEQGRYEECLGTRSRRLADPRLLYRAVAEEADADRAQTASTHANILRLSRDFEGRQSDLLLLAVPRGTRFQFALALTNNAVTP